MEKCKSNTRKLAFIAVGVALGSSLLGQTSMEVPPSTEYITADYNFNTVNYDEVISEVDAKLTSMGAKIVDSTENSYVDGETGIELSNKEYTIETDTDNEETYNQLKSIPDFTPGYYGDGTSTLNLVQGRIFDPEGNHGLTKNIVSDFFGDDSTKTIAVHEVVTDMAGHTQYTLGKRILNATTSAYSKLLGVLIPTTLIAVPLYYIMKFIYKKETGCTTCEIPSEPDKVEDVELEQEDVELNEEEEVELDEIEDVELEQEEVELGKVEDVELNEEVALDKVEDGAEGVNEFWENKKDKTTNLNDVNSF